MTLSEIQYVLFSSLGAGIVAVILLVLFLTVKKEYCLAKLTLLSTINGLVGIFAAAFVVWKIARCFILK